MSVSTLTGDFSSPSVIERQKAVGFGNVEVREHGYTLGKRSPTSEGKGVPVDLNWDAHSVSIITLEEFEASRGPRRTPKDLVQSNERRKNLLLEAGFNSEEIQHGLMSDESDEGFRRRQDTKAAEVEEEVDHSFYEDFAKQMRNTKNANQKRGFFGLFRRNNNKSKQMIALSEL
jgi:hypothetical protein